MSYRTILYCALLLAVAGCDSTETARAPAVADEWYREVDNPAHEFIKYPTYLYREVIEPLVPEAVAALGANPLLQLSTSEAERYAGSKMNMPMELRPFLIYGLEAGDGGFTVFIADRALWVDNSLPVAVDGKVSRRPLVIFIDEVPPDVYVTLGAAAVAPAAQQPGQ